MWKIKIQAFWKKDGGSKSSVSFTNKKFLIFLSYNFQNAMKTTLYIYNGNQDNDGWQMKMLFVDNLNYDDEEVK